jgi:hypothetical protein
MCLDCAESSCVLGDNISGDVADTGKLGNLPMQVSCRGITYYSEHRELLSSVEGSDQGDVALPQYIRMLVFMCLTGDVLSVNAMCNPFSSMIFASVWKKNLCLKNLYCAFIR